MKNWFSNLFKTNKYNQAREDEILKAAMRSPSNWAGVIASLLDSVIIEYPFSELEYAVVKVLHPDHDIIITFLAEGQKIQPDPRASATCLLSELPEFNGLREFVESSRPDALMQGLDPSMLSNPEIRKVFESISETMMDETILDMRVSQLARQAASLLIERCNTAASPH